MADLLAETAQQWQGWTGSKEWRSLEGELAFVWSHDGLGRVTFLVTLDARLVWRTEATIPVEAGQLGRIAAEFRSFCSPA